MFRFVSLASTRGFISLKTKYIWTIYAVFERVDQIHDTITKQRIPQRQIHGFVYKQNLFFDKTLIHFCYSSLENNSKCILYL